MNELQTLYLELEKTCDFEQEGNTEKFLDTVDKIINIGDPKSIKVLLKYFDDDTDFGWVLESLMIALEAYPDESYVEEIIKSVPTMLEQAPNWLLSIIYGILNEPHAYIVFNTHMNLIPKKDMAQLLDLVAQESEHHRELCAELKKEVYKKS